MSKKFRASMVAVLVGVLGLATACGGDDGDGGGGSAELTPAQQQVVDEAGAAFDRYTQIQEAAAVPELPAPAPTGKRLVMVTCSIPVCVTLSDGAREAAEKLGWTVSTLQTNSTPEGYTSAMNQVAADPPDALAYISALPDSSVAKQLAKIHAAGTRIVAISPLGDPLAEADTPIGGVVFGQRDAHFTGTLMAQSVLADADGPVESVFVWDPSFEGSWGPIKAGFEATMKSAGAEPGILEVSNANIGKTVPSQIVSYLQAHPDTAYVALAVVDYNAGLAAALQAAGLQDRVKIISRAADAAALEAIQAGKQWASIGLELAAAGYRVVDQLIRLMTDVPLEDRADPIGWQQVYVEDNVSDADNQVEPPEYAQAYYDAWHVG
ncbi:substrate-binding domain-containing protein [Nocardioides sp. LHD-245]|uniref:substrate-binding domain-containing protein n=1 Tax=Nocardioides sp. LHD-245 TaxID=3051387 RepID=UPI0027E05B0C|nr:substrate-binding domain-containing protein [Nocardioides sp. LHD-245]